MNYNERGYTGTKLARYPTPFGVGTVFSTLLFLDFQSCPMIYLLLRLSEYFNRLPLVGAIKSLTKHV
eukprot:c18799_g1_i1 orf=363-563(+)